MGDRIAIMSDGIIKCCGSPMFLKRNFGTGYHLRIAKGDNFHANKVENVLKKHLPEADMKSEIHTEVIYSLGNNNAASKFADLFEDIEMRKNELGIATCGLSITTMEDVFLKVGNELDDNTNLNVKPVNGNKVSDTDTNESSGASSAQFMPELLKLEGIELLAHRLKGLFLKRYHYSKRYWPMLIFQIFLPSLLFAVILVVDFKIKQQNHKLIELDFDLGKMYGHTRGFYEGEKLDKFPDNYYVPTALEQEMQTTVLTKDPNLWLLSQSTEISSYIKTYLVGGIIKSNKLQIWFNNEALHSVPASINIMYTALQRYILQDNNTFIQTTITPLSSDDADFGQISKIFIGIIVSCYLLVPLTLPFIAASYTLFPIHERVSKVYKVSFSSTFIS